MSLGVSYQKANNLKISCDWLSFTVLNNNYSVEDVCNFLGYAFHDFTEMPKGGNGYSSMIKLDGFPVMILYNGKSDMGIHVSISGSAITEVLSKYKESKKIDGAFGSGYLGTYGIESYLSEFLKEIRSIGQLSRIDLALDDQTNDYFSLDDLLSYVQNEQVVSKFRGYRHIKESSLSGELNGQGIYFGSRKSDIMLRVYDKKIEQEKKGHVVDCNSWVRWEFELKNDRANSVADLIIANSDIGYIFTGILNTYFRVINLDDTNRSRCSMLSLWADFVDNIHKIKLSVVSAPATLERKKEWFISQCAPTLAGLILADGGDLSIVTDGFDQYVSKMSRDMLDILQKEVPGWDLNYYGGVA